MEVGAYQIIIQPNTFKQQISGFHLNHSEFDKGPAEGGTKVAELTGQQVNTVIAIDHDSGSANGTYSLILAEATMADVRGCEIIINEVMLDFEPDSGSQFTNLPTLGLYNPLGVNETISPSLSRRSLPYRPDAFRQATPGYTVTVPWWSHLHKEGAKSSSATKWLNLEWLKPDNYYEASRTTFGAVGGQITMGGYPSSYFDIYEDDKRLRSLNPGCVVISSDSSARTITVDNNDLFPVVPYYGELLEYVDTNGVRRTASYANRTGTLAYATLGSSITFATVVGNAEFWSNLAVGTILKLSGPYDNWQAGEIYKESTKNITPRLLPQTLHGTRDTNSLHSPDAFLCLWHPNLGRPFTWYSDNSVKTAATGSVTIVGLSVAATATITVIDSSSPPGVPFIGEGDKIELIATDGQKVTLTLGGQSGITTSAVTDSGTLDAKTLASGSYASTTLHAIAQADEIMRAINYHTKFSATKSSNVITVTQAVGGTDGNTTITITELGATGMSKTNFSGGTSDSTDINQLHHTNGFTITDAGGVAKEYIFDKAAALGATGTAHADGVVIQVNGMTTASAVAAETRTAILHANGHNGSISAVLSGSVVNLTQTVLGTVGNVTISPGSLPAAYITFSGMSGGVGVRKFYTKEGATDTPLLQTALNLIPEHFETIHYHDFFYTASKGPFGLKMMTTNPPVSSTTADGTVYTATAIDALVDGGSTLDHQGGTVSSNKYNFAGFWPGGSRGGAGVSRLDGFGESLIGWGNMTFGMDCVGFDDSSGIRKRTYAQMTSASDFARNYCFGYRFGIRQPYNRPRWGPAVRGYLELANAQALLGYYHGPLVQQDGRADSAGGWDYVGADTTQADATFPATYVGIIERLTQVTALLNEDQLGRQVRYSDGRRMTRPFGCPVRTLRNGDTIRRMYPGDDTGKGIEELANAHRYYMVDWWGNTRGEDVRRFPARGFGIRPAWDPEDAYLDGGSGNRFANVSLFRGDLTDAQSGNVNTDNNDVSAMATVDWFNPASAMRVGDRGDGRGLRWPTVFNESLLHDISADMKSTGLVLSHSTAEPNFGQGLIRPRNDDLQPDEVTRGISRRLGVADADGLLSPAASVGEGVESLVGSFSVGPEVLADPVARSGPRIGLDADTFGEINQGVNRDYVAIASQAYSLHTDREVGQRISLRGAMDIGSATLGHFDMTSLNWATQPKSGIVKMSNVHSMWGLGGSYIMEVKNHAESIDDTGWGISTGTSSNPYQDSNHKPLVGKTNTLDKAIKFLIKPMRALDSQHFALFRHAPAVKAGAPQVGNNYYRSTSGGKYGMFSYDIPNARTGTISPTSPPYQPVYRLDPTSSTTVPVSQGPNIPGADVTGFDKTSIRQTTGRMVMSENTLEHFRSDAPRRRTEKESDKDSRADYTIQPRFSQGLHPKGEDGTTSFNTGDHSGE